MNNGVAAGLESSVVVGRRAATLTAAKSGGIRQRQGNSWGCLRRAPSQSWTARGGGQATRYPDFCWAQRRARAQGWKCAVSLVSHPEWLNLELPATPKAASWRAGRLLGMSFRLNDTPWFRANQRMLQRTARPVSRPRRGKRNEGFRPKPCSDHPGNATNRKTMGNSNGLRDY